MEIVTLLLDCRQRGFNQIVEDCIDEMAIRVSYNDNIKRIQILFFSLFNTTKDRVSSRIIILIIQKSNGQLIRKLHALRHMKVSNIISHHNEVTTILQAMNIGFSPHILGQRGDRSIFKSHQFVVLKDHLIGYDFNSTILLHFDAQLILEKSLLVCSYHILYTFNTSVRPALKISTGI